MEETHSALQRWFLNVLGLDGNLAQWLEPYSQDLKQDSSWDCKWDSKAEANQHQWQNEAEKRTRKGHKALKHQSDLGRTSDPAVTRPRWSTLQISCLQPCLCGHVLGLVKGSLARVAVSQPEEQRCLQRTGMLPWEKGIFFCWSCSNQLYIQEFAFSYELHRCLQDTVHHRFTR